MVTQRSKLGTGPVAGGKMTKGIPEAQEGIPSI